jgi:hypothetical protein
MNPLHATIEEFAAEDYTHVECSARDAACGVVATATPLAEELESLDPPLLSDDAVKRHAQRFTATAAMRFRRRLIAPIVRLGPPGQSGTPYPTGSDNATAHLLL